MWNPLLSVTLCLLPRNQMLRKAFDLDCLWEQRLTALEAEGLLAPKKKKQGRLRKVITVGSINASFV